MHRNSTTLSNRDFSTKDSYFSRRNKIESLITNVERFTYPENNVTRDLNCKKQSVKYKNKKPSYCWERADHTALSGIAVQQWLFQMRKFCRFACLQCVFNLFARWHQPIRFKRWTVWRNRFVEGLKVVKFCSWGRFLFTRSDTFVAGRLATMHSVTDRQTDRQRDKRQHYANSGSYSVQYDRLKLL